MNRMGTRPLRPVIVIAGLVGISPFATDMYLPALPAIATDLNASTDVVQLSLTAFLVGLAVGQLVLGPISDGIGRRRLLLAGTAAFALASVACALAPNAWVLVIARVVQGVAGAAGVVCGRATVSDTRTGRDAHRLFSTIAAITAIGPAAAPLLGGLVLLGGDWRWIFAVLAVVGSLLFVGVLLFFPESLPAEARDGTSVRSTIRRVGVLLTTGPFVRYVVLGCIATAGFFTYIAAGSFVFQQQLGASEFLYTIIFAVNAGMMILSTSVMRRLVARFNPEVTLLAGLLICTTGSVVLFGLAAAGIESIAAAWVCLAAVTAGWGFLTTSSVILAQQAGAAYAGTAAALQGGLVFGVGGLMTPLTGIIGENLLAMSSIMALMLSAATVFWFASLRWRVKDIDEAPVTEAVRAEPAAEL